MTNERIQLRLAKYNDFEGYLRLKSEEHNIYWSGFSEKPSPDRLMSHFLSAIESQTRKFYLLFEQDKTIGYLYVDYDREPSVAEISYGISRSQSGRGLAKLMINKGLVEVGAEFSVIVAWIATTNIPSIKSVEALGFQRSDEHEYRAFSQENEPVKFCKYVKCFGNKNEL